jgi:hypothetical protein
VSRALAALVLVALVAMPAAAETIALPSSTAKLVLPDGWTAVKAPGVVAAYRTEGGAVLAVTRASVPNPDAWRAQTRAAYADKVERGIRAGIPGYKPTAKKLVEASGMPALDIEATRDGGATVLVRVLLFHTYALSLAIEVPRGGDLAAARAIIQAFAPPPKP